MGGGGDGGTAFSYRANHLKFNRSQNLEHLHLSFHYWKFLPMTNIYSLYCVR